MPQNVQQVFGQRDISNKANSASSLASTRRVGPPVAPRPSVVQASTPPVAAERNAACSVCQEPNRQGLVKLGCSHDFNKDCILPWVTGRDADGDRQEHCPNCRTPIIDADKTKLGIAVQAAAPAFTGSSFASSHPVSDYISPEVQEYRDRGDASMAAIVNRMNASIAVLPNGRRLIYGSRGQEIGHLSAIIANNLESNDLLGRLAQDIESIHRATGSIFYVHPNLDALALTDRDAIRVNTQLLASANRSAANREAEDQRRADDAAAETQRILDRANRRPARRDGRRARTTSVRIGGVDGLIGNFGVLNMDNKGLTDISGLQNLSAADKAKVCTISLRNNGIQNLPLGTFSNFPNLTQIDLTGNPLDGEVSPYATDVRTVRNLQKMRGLDLAELLEVRQMLNLPRSAVPAHLHSIHNRPFATEILDKLIRLTMDS